MDKLEKFKELSLKSVDASADIGLINRYSVKELTPKDVYCFSVILCDNDIDRDTERFANATLDALAPLFFGKTGISDHYWSAERQIARLYRVEVEDGGKNNALGEPLRVLRGSAYMLNNETNRAVIEAIEGGIMKEVSVGVRINKRACSVCGETLRLDWRTWMDQCENGHIKGESYDGELCYGSLEEPTDAYEFSFVAVPAQVGAGVTKGAENLDGAFKLIMAADLSGHADKIKAIIPVFQKSLMDTEEREARAKIIEDNEAFRERFAEI